MSPSGDGSAATPSRRRLRWGWLLAAAVVAILLAANAHLVYVAFSSQPACVSHLKAPDGTTYNFSAARSGC